MIYLYAITGPLTEPPEEQGLAGAPLETVGVGSLTAVYSSHEQLELRPDVESAWAHEHAVEAVMSSQTVLPARFGTTFPGLDELRDALIPHADALERRLEELEGCVELAVRIDPLIPIDGQMADGRQYLMEKLFAQRRREALAESALACLMEFAVASRVAPTPSSGETVSISYLVQTREVRRFSRAVARLQTRWPEFALSCTGPWAPYSFVTDEPALSTSTEAEIA
ncbi:MAG: GvpL/GvpF family gas vesicle protein [Solirubrobacteraceae bacterium]